MADRDWSGVDARLYKEFRISKPARLMLAYIIAHCPNVYGIYDPSPEYDCLDWFDGLFDRAQLVAAFGELVTCGIVQRLRDDTCLWLCKKFKREIGALRNPNQIKSAVQFLREYPEIETSFWAIYRNQFANKANQFAGLSNWLLTNWPHGATSCVYPEPEPEPEPEPKKAGAIAPPAANAALFAGDDPSETKLKPAIQALLPLAEKLAHVIKRACEIHGLSKPPANDPAKCARTLEQIIRLDGIPEAELYPLTLWAMHLKDDDTPLPGLPAFDWRINLQSIPQWRKVSERNGRTKIANARDGWVQARGASPAGQFGVAVSAAKNLGYEKITEEVIPWQRN